MPAHAASVPPSEWTDPRHVRGLRGELAAQAYLTARGWTVAAHRFRLGRQELDLVVRRDALVAFVEVKTRRSLRYGGGAEAVGWRKRRTLARVAAVWALRHGRWGDVYRFDVVEVHEAAGGRLEVRHLEDAWRLG